jgi:hypothetical protein
MAEGLILQFDGVTREQYDGVNAKLGIQMYEGTGDYPKGLRWHAAGIAEDGSFVVSEVWESREAQDEFMHTRLGEALAANGVTAVPTVTWFSLLAHQTPLA